MASGERLHKLSAEAFSRLRNDHEHFLEAYEKPTQIYRFLHARHSLKSLFMHRNLSYMRHHNSRRKKKRTSRIRIGDLLKYRKPHEPDLASRIKSDNFLKITFHNLEKGIDFSHLLSAALSGDVRSTPPTNHAPSLMEVEVLLYNCHQHASEAASCPCTSVSLGKFEVEYTPSKDAKIVGGCSANNHTLIIPESKLVWRGKSRGAGSMMLAFRARASTGQKSQKKSLQQSLNNVSIELNRINHSDIAQLAKTRQAAQTSTDGSTEPTNSVQCDRDSESRPAVLSTESLSSYEKDIVCSSTGLGENTSKATERHDACIMTDVSLGAGETSLSCENGVCNGALERGLPESEDDTSSVDPPLPKKGFTENSDSLLGKLAAQRNGLNGLSFLNGFADDHQSQATDRSHDDSDTAFLDSNKSDYSLTVSIPCTYRNGSRAASTGSLCMDTCNHSKRRYKVPARKRSEIQLLLDGDKPPGQRISAEEIPIFTAEDPSDRATRYMAHQSRGPWTQLGTGTRKITPVEPFAYPVSPTLTPKKATGIKRSLSESDVLSSDVSSPPPPKMVKVADSTEEVGENMKEVGIKEIGLDIQTPITKSKSPSPVPSPPPNFREEILCDEKAGVSAEQATGVAPEGLFCAEMVVYDSRGECLLDKGEYCILMQKCPEKDASSEQPPSLVTFPPLNWNSVFGGGEQSEVEQSDSMMLKFSLSWSQGPPKHRLLYEMETALDLQRIRNDYFPPTPRPTTATSTVNHNTTTSTTTATDISPTLDHNNSTPQPCNQPSNQPPNTTPAAVRDGEGDCACNGEGTADGEGEMDTTEKEKFPPENDPHSHYNQDCTNDKNDPEGYFTATEASASSVADSTELALCRPPASSSVSLSSIPPGSSSIPPGGRIIYNFLYHNNTLQQTESRGDMRCPWCSLACGKLYSLLKHMSLCHPRFLFTYTPMEGDSVIDVHVNKLYEAGQTSMDRDPVERNGMNLRQRWKGPLKCLPCTAIIVERHELVEEDLSEFLNDGSWKRGYNVKRQYYHSHTCMPMVPEDIAADSEAELESIGKWQKTCSQRMIDEFTDVNRGEKEMMKLWNLFAMEEGMTAYRQIPAACIQFTKEKGSEIVQKNIVYSFLAHLTSLCDFGLITPSVIKTCMDALDTVQPS